MTKEELADKFLELDLNPLFYMTDIAVNWRKCLLANKDGNKVVNDIFKILTTIENLQEDFNKSNEV